VVGIASLLETFGLRGGVSMRGTAFMAVWLSTGGIHGQVWCWMLRRAADGQQGSRAVDGIVQRARTACAGMSFHVLQAH